jgi:uncharacterized protein YjiS (DUF1127 family)
METVMHKRRDFSAAFEPAKCNRFRTLYSALKEWSVAHTARRQQADALFGLDAHILEDIGISKAMLLDCETGSSIYPDCGSPVEHEVNRR